MCTEHPACSLQTPFSMKTNGAPWRHADSSAGAAHAHAGPERVFLSEYQTQELISYLKEALTCKAGITGTLVRVKNATD